MRPSGSVRQIDHARDGDARLAQLVARPRARGRREASTTARDPGLIEKSRTKRRTALGQHHPDEVVPREDERLLDARRSRRRSARRGSGRARCRSRRERGSPPRSRARGPARAPRRLRARRPSSRRASSTSTTPGPARPPRPRAARPAGPPPTTRTRRSPVLDVVAPRVARLAREPPEAGEVAEHLLVHRPQPPRPDHRPVVEADRRERPADLVRDGEQVAVRASPRRSAARRPRPLGSARRRRARSARRRRSSCSWGSAPSSRGARAAGGT